MSAAIASDKMSESGGVNNSSGGHGHHKARLSFRKRKVKRNDDDSNDTNNGATPGAGPTLEAATIFQNQPPPLPSSATSEPSTSSHQIVSINSEQLPIEQISDVNNNNENLRKHQGDVDKRVNDDDDEGKHSTVGIELKTMDKKLKQKHTHFIDTQPDLHAEGEIKQQHCGCIQIPIEHAEFIDDIAHDVSSFKNTLSVLLFLLFCFILFCFHFHFYFGFGFLFLLLCFFSSNLIY